METVGLLLKPWLRVKHTSRDQGKAQWGIPACSALGFGVRCWGSHKGSPESARAELRAVNPAQVLLVGPFQLGYSVLLTQGAVVEQFTSTSHISFGVSSVSRGMGEQGKPFTADSLS